MAAGRGVLYLSYDGMLEPLGQSQVLAYLEPLARDRPIHLISFEKARDMEDAAAFSALRTRIERAGIHWHPRRYHKRPPIVSTLWDMGGAMLAAIRIGLRHRLNIFHARSVLSAAMLWPAKAISRGRFLVDIRGFWADERVDGGMIAEGGIVYRVLKLIERAMLRDADHIVTLTHASVPVLQDDPRMGHPTAPIAVIPTCADLALFAAPPTGVVDAGRPFVLGYVGQVGTWYMLDEMIAFFAAVHARRADARLLIVNQHQQPAIRAALAKANMDPTLVEIRGAERWEVPGLIARMTIAMALITPRFSKIASAPTKLAEYLGCGVPVFGNVGCGDMAAVIRNNRVGIAVDVATPAAIATAADDVLRLLDDPGLAERCVATARRLFALDHGVADYARIYADLER